MAEANSNLVSCPSCGRWVTPGVIHNCIADSGHSFAWRNPGVYCLTKREYFAALAMQGLIMALAETVRQNDIAAMAIGQADALIAALEEE